MKFLIIGLGNPGAEYEHTRHNVGFRVVDTIAEAHGGSFSTERHGAVSTVRFKGKSLILLKPSTYMNLSGKAVRYWMEAEKISVDRILVITDDLNLPLESIRLRAKGSDGGHNGLKDIQNVLGSNVYPRLRVGVGDDFGRGRQVEYVLGEWTNDENLVLQEILVKSSKAVESFCSIGLERAMNSMNS
ncbi:MAG TPA: aminoacyl-tRNA hydrolase [Flavobacteriales bacterium]|jgi:PTH1 family peptidyl-tRNA hydrolase|nr:aminoacyl-tRNA hydrolase [Flavobacteriales bacterium]HHZ97902.1 aminoacyl-tRNA hydrolase [Flavobacteriales bacterium]HIB78493.1 aminoacyl-tRNA hydrolase [Flavobacteriales bacterium]HIN40875.1 aminoacyl-tRNA hydrolase [Flavobacteriales bacterium]HIO16358.1 aminoacyl-tRNA hydrolase [Flavobacteriales bacterium]